MKKQNIVQQAFNKAMALVTHVRTHWKVPAEGRYMPFKEIAAYSGGGIGIYCIIYMSSTLMISGTNVVLSNATGISPSRLLIIYYIAVLLGIPLTGLKAHLIDNLRLKSGKYRPWILGMGIPSALLCMAIIFTPYHDISKTATYILVTVYSVALHFIYNFFYEAYVNLIFLLSPNTQERADVASIKSVTYSFAPTVINPLLPLMVKLLNTGDMFDIKIYQTLFPVVTIIGIVLSIVVFANTKEKIVQARTHVNTINFWDALKAVAKNKYFWITSLATWISFLEAAQGSIMGWLYNYGKLCSEGQYAIITVVYGNASLWGMLAAPFCIRKWGKRNVLVVTNLFNILFIALMYPSVGARSIWLVFICLWFNAVMGSFAHILTPAINADIRDYQHYISGERIDGMFGAVGIITNFVTMATNSVLPMIYERYGITENNGFTDPFDILGHDLNAMYALVNTLIIISVIGATLNVLPYFFYDLSEVKQRAMVSILKIRALFEDYGNKALTDKTLIEGVDILRKAQEGYQKEFVVADKKDKKAYKEAKRINEEIEIDKMVMSEYTKFSTDEYIFKYNHAKEAVAAGLAAALEANKDMIAKAKAMPKNTAEEKAIRSYLVTFAKQINNSKKIITKHYNGNLPEFDAGIFETLFAKQDENDSKKREAYLRLDKAKEDKNSELIKEIKAEIKEITNEGYAIKGEIKQATRDNTKYNRATKFYKEAQKLVKQKEDFENIEEIYALYDDAVIRVNEAKLASAN